MRISADLIRLDDPGDPEAASLALSAPSRWARPTASLTLRSGAIDLWRVPLDLGPEAVHASARHLSDDEHQRAGRFVFPRDRDRYLVGRGQLRAILGIGYLGLDPGQVRFRYGPRGKPALRGPGEDLRFNLANSRGLALVAVARGIEVGVDLEAVRPIPEASSIIERNFSPAERNALRALPEDQHIRAFFACWTRKEAYLKALGNGLAAPLDRFTVSVDPDGPARLVDVEGQPEVPMRWIMFGLDPAPGYMAAVVAERPRPA